MTENPNLAVLERWRFRDGKVVEITPHYFNAM